MLQNFSKKSGRFWAVLATLLVTAAMSQAATFTWDGSASSDWFDANNWTPDGVPSGSDTAIIEFGGASIGNNSVSIASLNLNGGSVVGGTGTLTLTGASTFNTGAIGAKVNNTGTVTWPSTAGNINVLADSVFNNNGTFNAAANATWAAFSGGSGQQFNNIGTLNANRPANAVGSPQFGGGANFKNTGTVHVISNNLGISDGTSSGTFNCDANAFVLFNGNPHTLTNSARCRGAGSTRIQTTAVISGTIIGGEAGGKLELSGGTLTTAGTGTITGTLLLSGGAFSGTLNANGITNWPAGAGNINALLNSVFNNNGTFNAGANASWAAFSGGTGQQFNNKGILNVDKPGIPGIFIPFTQTSSGTFDVDLGGTSAGSGYDQLHVGTPVTLGGALTVSATFTPAIGDTFTILANDGTDAIIGTFAGLPQNATLIANNVIFRIIYNGGDGNDVVLTRLPAANLSVNDVSIVEGSSGTKNAIFTVSLSSPTPETVTVNTVASNGTAKSPGDFTAGGQSLTFAPNQLSQTVSVPIVGDTTDEDNETFFVLLSSPNNAGILRGRGVGTITDDDAPPTISIENLNIKEYNSGQTTAVFRLNLSAPSGKLVKVNYATAVGTTNPATPGSDYVAVAPTTISFTTGQTVTLGRVLINGDVLPEANETLLINLSSPINATIADNQAVGTILNDDAPPSLSINDVSIAEGNSGTKQLTFTVTLSKASGQNVSVNFATANGTAVSSSDYAAQNGTLTFAPGSALTRTINITINGDTIVEGNETFFIFLSAATNASIAKARGVATITNDDVSG